jgi:hypothetical protein
MYGMKNKKMMQAGGAVDITDPEKAIKRANRIAEMEAKAAAKMKEMDKNAPKPTTAPKEKKMAMGGKVGRGCGASMRGGGSVMKYGKNGM